MSPRFTRLLMIAVALWLPVQTVAAAAMSTCQHAPAQPAEAVSSAPCHEHGAETVPDQAGHDSSCDHCEMCHLACAGFMPSAPVAAAFPLAARAYVLPAIVAPPSHIAEPPQHPPRRDA